MLRHVTAIVLCFSLVGLTVLPAAYLPCCCKMIAKSMPPKNASCCSMHKPDAYAANPVAHVGVASCCGSRSQVSSFSHSAMNQASCCTGTFFKKPCPLCRCLEKMQIVALAESQTSETVIRVAADAVPITVRPICDFASTTSNVGPQRASPGIVITLQTCSFRC